MEHCNNLPIPKIKNRLETRGYRPISILCLISKGLERIAADQIKPYLDEYDIEAIRSYTTRGDKEMNYLYPYVKPHFLSVLSNVLL